MRRRLEAAEVENKLLRDERDWLRDALLKTATR
jgi:hypothetical protein